MRLADKFATGKVTLKGLETEARTGRSRAARSNVDPKDVVLKVAPHLLTLKLQLRREERTDEQLSRVRDAMSQVLSHLGISGDRAKKPRFGSRSGCGSDVKPQWGPRGGQRHRLLQ